MTFKEIQAKAGQLSAYVWYVLPVFLWYFLDNEYTSLKPVAPGNSIEPLLDWGLRIVLVPAILAGLFGGIHERQQSPEISTVRGFFTGVRRHYWRMLAANLLALALYVLAVVALAIAGVLPADLGEYTPLLAFVAGIFSALTLFWLAVIVVEHSVFQALPRAGKALVFNPYALITGITWATLGSADTFFFDAPGVHASLVLNGVRAAVLAVARIIAIVYALAVYKQARGEAPAGPSDDAALVGSPSTSSGDGWVWAGFGFALIAFIPLMHLLALIFGGIALRRKKRFVFRAAIACCVGGFFTLFYGLVVAGLIAAGAAPSKAPGYAFLAEANPDLGPQVALLEHGSTQDIRLQLGQDTANTSDRNWTLDAVAALAAYKSNDLNGALADFRTAAGKNPDRSEFYYYYGSALLDDGQTDAAAGQFQTALTHAPKLEAAERYRNLIATAYKPSTLVSGLLFVIILLILFTLHEYGHAFAAWKLGDDTAKSLGRLTLNPIPHLDLFGSIILPGVLLWQQSGVIFGWAKPVPVNPANFQNPRRDHMRVAFAGPAVNLVVVMICFVLLGGLMLLVRLAWPETLSLNLAAPFAPVSIAGPPVAEWLVYVVVFLKQLLYTSLVLGCFNLIPVPPLDGSWILSSLLPERLGLLYEKSRRYGFLIYLLLFITPVFDSVLTVPLGAAWAGLAILFSSMGLG